MWGLALQSVALLLAHLSPRTHAVCVVPTISWVGDGLCDEGVNGYNTPECQWDGGDCCEDTCVSAKYQCGSAGYLCRRPNSTVCADLQTCSNCASQDGCGWCATTQTCVDSDANGPLSGSCPLWEGSAPQCDQHSPTFWVNNESIPITPALYGPDAYVYPPITGPLKQPASNDACEELPENSLAGAVALLRSGSCFFVEASLNAQKAGAVAVVIYVDVAYMVAPNDFNQSLLTIPTLKARETDGLRLVESSLDSPCLVGLVGEGPLFLNSTVNVLSEQGVILFDPDYVATHDEGGRVLLSLEAVNGENATVQVPVHKFATSLASKPKYAVIPPQEAGSVVAYMTNAERDMTRDYVLNGGSLILFGDRFDYALQMANSIFGLNLTRAQGVCSDLQELFEATPREATLFASPLPLTLDPSVKTYCVLEESVPTNGSVYYVVDDGQTLSPLVHLRLGNGTLTWLGADWNQFPTLLAWEGLLGRAARSCVDGCNAPVVGSNTSLVIIEAEGATARPEALFLASAIGSTGVKTPFLNLTEAGVQLTGDSPPSFVVIPKMDVDYRQWMIAEARSAIIDYVNGGGYLLAVGDQADMLNDLFGFDVSSPGGCRGATRNPDVEGSPSAIYGDVDTYCLEQLPANATSLYVTMQEFRSMAAVFSVGNGAVFTYGYDFGLSPAPLALAELMDEIVARPEALKASASPAISSAVPVVTVAAGCEGSNVTLTCENGEIDLISATYGSDGQDTNTPSACLAAGNELCESLDSMDVARTLCQGRSTCALGADNFAAANCTSPQSLRVKYRCLPGVPMYTEIGEGFCRDKDMHRPSYCGNSRLSPEDCEKMCTSLKGCQAYTTDTQGADQQLSQCNLYFDSDGYTELDLSTDFECEATIIDWGGQVTKVLETRPSGRVPRCFLRSVELGCADAAAQAAVRYPAGAEVMILFSRTPVSQDPRFSEIPGSAPGVTDQGNFVAVRAGATQWEYAGAGQGASGDADLRWWPFVPVRTDVLVAEVTGDALTALTSGPIGMSHGVVSGFSTSPSSTTIGFTLDSTGAVSVSPGQVCVIAGAASLTAAPTSASGTVAPSVAPATSPITAPTVSATTTVPTAAPVASESTNSPTTVPTVVPSQAPTVEVDVEPTRSTVILTLNIEYSQVTETFKKNFDENLITMLDIPAYLLSTSYAPGSTVCTVVITSSEEDGVKSEEKAEELAKRDINELSSELDVEVESVDLTGQTSTDSGSSSSGSDSSAPIAVSVIVILFVVAVAAALVYHCFCRRSSPAAADNNPELQLEDQSYNNAPSRTPSVSLGNPSLGAGEMHADEHIVDPATGNSDRIPSVVEPMGTNEGATDIPDADQTYGTTTEPVPQPGVTVSTV